MRRRSLIEYLDSPSPRGEEIAFVHRRGYRTVRWSYGRLARVAAQVARELERRQINKGDRVLLWGENSAEWVATFLGCALRGAVVVPVDRIANAEFARRVAQQVDAKLVVRSRDVPPLESTWPALELESLEEALARHSSEPYPAPAVERNDPLEIVFTSGTTAEPKGVVISHGNLLASLEPVENEIQHYLSYERFFHPVRFLNLLPLSHVFGQLMGIFIPQLLGGTVILADSLNPGEVIRVIRRERVSVLVAVPRLAESLRDKLERDIEDAGRLARFRKDFQAADGEHFLKRWWRFRKIRRRFGWKFWAIISGGAALSADAELFWRRLGYAMVQGYGLTETAALVSVNHPFRLGTGSIGKTIPGLEVQLDSNGEILVRGESIATGYWQGKRLEPVAGQDGWFHTGDMGERDAEGNLYFKGRRKNVIVTPAGMNIYPEDLEGALRHQPEVRDCVVVGLERDGNAEPCAVLLLRDPSANPEAIVARANQSLAEYQKMRRWTVWTERDFPRTPTQKPRLREIQQQVAAQLSKEAAGIAGRPQSPLADLLARILPRTASVPQAISADTRLATDLNLSSIDRVELLSALEDRYQMDLSETGFSEAATVGDLERLLREPPLEREKFVYPRWAQRWPVTWIRFAVYYCLVWTATKILASPRLSGRENLRGVRGPVLVIANHITRSDVGFVLAALPPRLRYRLAVAMKGETLRAMRHPPAGMGIFRRLLERLNYALVVALFNVFPLPQQSGYRESFSFAGESVDRGWSVLVFPEGQRTRDGKMAPFRSGIGLLAMRLNLPVIPIRIDGLFELKQARKKFARPGHVRVTVGEPVRFGPDADPEAIARELERRVAALASC
jgi:long-chain acyl-CoA synthetase